MNKISLFLNKNSSDSLGGTLTGKLLGKINSPKLSSVLMLLAIIILFYNSLMVNWFDISLQLLVPWLLLLALIFSDKGKIKLTKTNYWYLCFVLILSISSILAVTSGLNPKLILLGFLLILQFGFSFLLGQTQRIIDFSKKLILISAPLLLISIYQVFSNFKSPSTWVSVSETGLNRAFATFGSPNILGILTAIIVLVGTYLYFERRKMPYLIIVGASLFATIATYSRTAWISLLVSLLLVLLIKNYKYLAFLPLTLVLLSVPRIRVRMLNIFQPIYIVDATLDGRLWGWINGIYLLKKKFLLGFGPGSYGGQLAINYSSPVYLTGIQNGYTAIYYTDNQILEILIQAGVLGFLSFLGFLYSLFVNFIRLFQDRGNNSYILGISITTIILISSFFSNVLEFGAVSIPAGIIIGACIND